MAHRLLGRTLVLMFLTVAPACGGSSSKDSARSESGGTGGGAAATATGARSGSSGSTGASGEGQGGSGGDLSGGSGGGSGASAGSGGDLTGSGGDSTGSAGHPGSDGGRGGTIGAGGDAGHAGSGANIAELFIRPSSSPADVGEAAVGKTGTSPKYLTVSNIGDAPSEPLTVSASDPQFVFLVDTCTGMSLDALEGDTSCQLGLVLRPTQTGVINGVVTVSDDAGVQISIAVTGTGTPYCLLTATPDSLDFGSAPVGFTTSGTITLTNTGDTPSGTLAVSLDANDGRFSISEDTCDGVSLDPGASCTLTVAYEAHPMSSPNIDIVVTPEVGAPVSIPLEAWGIV